VASSAKAGASVLAVADVKEVGEKKAATVKLFNIKLLQQARIESENPDKWRCGLPLQSLVFKPGLETAKEAVGIPNRQEGLRTSAGH
jgi:hypothetical protein